MPLPLTRGRATHRTPSAPPPLHDPGVEQLAREAGVSVEGHGHHDARNLRRVESRAGGLRGVSSGRLGGTPLEDAHREHGHGSVAMLLEVG